MTVCPIPKDEVSRLQAVHDTNLLNTGLDFKFEIATSYVADVFRVPCVMCALVDKDRVWIKSVYGADISEIPRELSICGHAICANYSSFNIFSRIFEVPDLVEDTRFCQNELMLNELDIKSYIGYVLKSENRKNIGVLSLLDCKPRTYFAGREGITYKIWHTFRKSNKNGINYKADNRLFSQLIF